MELSPSFRENCNLVFKSEKVRKEFLYLLIKNRNTILSNQYIKEMLWNEEVNDERLRTFIKRLRLKTSKSIVENISAQGYLISVLNS